MSEARLIGFALKSFSAGCVRVKAPCRLPAGGLSWELAASHSPGRGLRTKSCTSWVFWVDHTLTHAGTHIHTNAHMAKKK